MLCRNSVGKQYFGENIWYKDSKIRGLCDGIVREKVCEIFREDGILPIKEADFKSLRLSRHVIFFAVSF